MLFNLYNYLLIIVKINIINTFDFLKNGLKAEM